MAESPSYLPENNSPSDFIGSPSYLRETYSPTSPYFSENHSPSDFIGSPSYLRETYSPRTPSPYFSENHSSTEFIGSPSDSSENHSSSESIGSPSDSSENHSSTESIGSPSDSSINHSALDIIGHRKRKNSEQHDEDGKRRKEEALGENSVSSMQRMYCNAAQFQQPTTNCHGSGGFGNPTNFPTSAYHPSNTSYNVTEILTFSSCVLYPPDPSKRITRKKKPLGCRTVIVSDLPMVATEEIMKEIFNSRGDVIRIKMSRRFARVFYIRFSREPEVEEALKLSGYQLKIKDNNDLTHSSWIHVDYARGRDNKKYLEIAAREAEHKLPKLFGDCVFKEKLLKLFRDGVFKDGVALLTTWMDKGEVQKENSISFFTVLQSLNCNVMISVQKKVRFEQKYIEEKEMKREILLNHLSLLKFIEKIFALAEGQHNLAKFPTLSMWHNMAKAVADVAVAEQAKNIINLCNKESRKSNSCLEEFDTLREKLKEAEKSLALVLEDKKRVEKEMTAKNMYLVQHTEKVILERNRLQEEFHALKKSCLKTGNFYRNNNQADNDTYLRDAEVLSDIFQFLLVHPFEVGIDYINSYLNKKKNLFHLQPQLVC